MTARSAFAIGALAAVMAGCAASYVVVPAAGGHVAAASTGGVSMAAYPESWQGYPEDLPKYLTPIWLSMVNQTSHDVRISYQDFVLTDPSGFRYAAISPYSGQPQVSTRSAIPRPASTAGSAAPTAAPQPRAPASPTPPSEQPPPSPTRSAPPSGDQAQPAPATRGSAPGSGLTDETGSTWGGKMFFAHTARRGAAFHGGPYRGFHGHRSFHTDVYIGPGPFFYDPWPHWYGPYPYYYGPYVRAWDYGYYPGVPSADILGLGLPEGVLPPGAHVAGFVYFQQAARQPGRLDLTWNVHGTDGRAIVSVTAPLRVVSD